MFSTGLDRESDAMKNVLKFAAALLLLVGAAQGISVSMSSDAGNVEADIIAGPAARIVGSMTATEGGILSDIEGTGDVTISQLSGGAGHVITSTGGSISSSIGQHDGDLLGSLKYDGYQLVDSGDLQAARNTGSTITTTNVLESGGAFSYTINGQPAAYDGSLDPTLSYHTHHSRWYLSTEDFYWTGSDGHQHLYDSNRLGAPAARGMNAWNAAGATVGERPFDYLGSSGQTSGAGLYDGVNLIAIARGLPQNVLARTTIRSDAISHHMIEGEIDINAGRLETLNSDLIMPDLMMFHEFGHVVGVSDLGPNMGCPETMKTEIMYYNIAETLQKYTTIPAGISRFSKDVFQRKMNVLNQH